MLDINVHNSRNDRDKWNSLTDAEKRLKRKKGRYYHALISGLTWHQADDCYFLTLTSKYRDNTLEKHWELLVKTLRWEFGAFEYVKLETNEGNGVLHVVYAGSRLDVKRLRAVWKKLHSSPQLRVDQIQRGDNERLKVYLLRQYLSSQDAYVRFSCSRNWVFPGFRTSWMQLVKKVGYNAAKALWGAFMETHEFPGQRTWEGNQVDTPSEKKQYRRERRKIKKLRGKK